MVYGRQSRLKTLAKAALAAGLGILGAFIVYLVLLCHPGLFFRHAFSHRPITLYSDEPMPASAERVLQDAENRLQRSPLFRDRPRRKFRIYICNQSLRTK